MHPHDITIRESHELDLPTTPVDFRQLRLPWLIGATLYPLHGACGDQLPCFVQDQPKLGSVRAYCEDADGQVRRTDSVLAGSGLFATVDELVAWFREIVECHVWNVVNYAGPGICELAVDPAGPTRSERAVATDKSLRAAGVDGPRYWFFDRQRAGEFESRLSAIEPAAAEAVGTQ